MKLKISNWRLNSEMNANNKVFRYGTCQGLFFESDDAVNVIAIINDHMGSGDFSRTMERLERYARDRRKPIRVLEFFNQRLKLHFITKRGYTDIGNNSVELRNPRVTGDSRET